MKKTLITLSALLTLLTACQKEPDLTDPANPPGGGTTNPPAPKNQLTRIVQMDGSDSVSIDFVYDAGNRPVKITAMENGVFAAEYRMYRNAAGTINRVVYVEASSPGALDSSEAKVGYDAANARYTYLLTPGTFSGNQGFDSTAFTYTGSGISSVTHYAKITSPLPLTIPYLRMDYTYNGTNVASVKQYTYDFATSTWSQVQYTTTYTHDTKTAAIKMGAEAVVLDLPNWAGDNNVLTQTDTDPGPPPTTTTTTTTYNYTSFNKPKDATEKEMPGNSVYTYRFYYN